MITEVSTLGAGVGAALAGGFFVWRKYFYSNGNGKGNGNGDGSKCNSDAAALLAQHTIEISHLKEGQEELKSAVKEQTKIMQDVASDVSYLKGKADKA